MRQSEAKGEFSRVDVNEHLLKTNVVRLKFVWKSVKQMKVLEWLCFFIIDYINQNPHEQVPQAGGICHHQAEREYL